MSSMKRSIARRIARKNMEDQGYKPMKPAVGQKLSADKRSVFAVMWRKFV